MFRKNFKRNFIDAEQEIDISERDKASQEFQKEVNRFSLLLNSLRGYLEEYNQCKDPKKSSRQAKNEFHMFQIWHDMHFQFEEHWKFAGLTSAGQLNPNYTCRLYEDRHVDINGEEEITVNEERKTEIEFYFKHPDSKFYDKLFKIWNVRIHPCVFEALSEINDKLLNDEFMSFFINNVLWGNFTITDEEINVMFGCATFFVQMNKDYKLFISTNIERIPIVSLDGNELIKHEFKQHLKILNIFHNNDLKNLSIPPRERTKARILVQNDPDKCKLFEEPLVRKVFRVRSYPILCRSYAKDWVSYGDYSSSYSANQQMKNVYVPMPIKLNGQLIAAAYQLFKFTGTNWVLEDEEKYYTSEVKLDEEAEKTINTESNREMILSFFEKLEKYGIKFEQSQKRMLVSPGNTLALGRSGTGKTTVSAFKILAIDLLFKAYSKAKVTGKQNVVLEPKDLSLYSGCGIIFCTASPVLTNEVRRYFKEINDKIKEYLLVKQKKRLKKKQEAEAKKKEDDKVEDFDDRSDKTDEDLEDIVGFDKEEQEVKEIQESIKIALESTQKDLEDVFEEETQKNLPPSVGDLASNDFPCFLTVKKLIYMLDASLTYPFFSRGADGRIYGMDSSTEWHNENKQGTFMINQYYKDAYDYSKKLRKLGKTLIQVEDIDDDEKLLRLKEECIDVEINDIAKKDAIDSDSDSDAENYDNTNIYENYKYVTSQTNYYIGKMKIEDQTFAQEVDFEMFEQKFWGKNKGRIKLSAMNVWTEIFSVIKGGLQTDWFSYIRRGSYSIMSKKNYMKLKSSMDYLSDKERLQIYWMYVKYESWKNSYNLYDFMDVVKHVFCNFPMHFKTKIDYLVVDEVQDLTPLTIQLLVSVTNKNVFFCGDTAQTIAKGVGFRFYDLKDIFDNKKVSIPSVIQLTKNYRSHSKILDLANSIVDVIECFFPQTIDKLQRESSDIDGPKPILLENFKDEDLMAMIIGHSETRNPTFGCNQVVIVRDQETKSTLPFFLKQALCLTVYEAKGLEFDDVILYNFFKNSPAGAQYRILKDIEICKGIRRKIKIEEQLTINELDYNQFKKRVKALEEEAKVHDGENTHEEELEEYTYFNVIRDRSDILRNFSALCNDLKHLYVSITRPKSRLLIYDQDESNRGAIREYWEECGVIDVVYKGQEKEHPILKGGFEALADEASSKEEWRDMGIKLFRKKFYMSAASCFENSGDEDLKHRCYAYFHADNASSSSSEAETLLYAAKNNKNLKKNEKTQKRTEAKKLKLKANKDYHLAGEMFEKIQLYRQAAQCFYTAEEYKAAADLFIKVEMFPQAAECFMITKDYTKAAEMFEESNLILKALECYEYLRDWEKILLCLNRNKLKFKENQRESLINKYVPIALNSIFRMLNSGDTEENRGKALEEKYFKDIPHIVEEQSEESEEDEPEPQVTEEQPSEISEKSATEDLKKEETIEEVKEETKEELKEKERKQESDSEEVIETGDKKEKLDDSSF